jgi:hypothetical protein
MLPVDAVVLKVEALRRLNHERDVRMRNVQQVRNGDVRTILPGFFPDYWPAPIVANHIDIVSRDLAEQIGKMPTLTCVASVNVSNLQKKFSIKRTKIAHRYVDVSNLRVKLPEAADWLVSYGFVPFIVEPDFEAKSPRVRAENPMNSYAELDIMGLCTAYAKVHKEPASKLAAIYPHLATDILGSPDPRVQARNQEQILSLIRYVDADQMVMYIPERNDLIIHRMPNPLGVCPVIIAKRAQYDEQTRGAMDDVLWIQLAKARMALFIQEGVEKSVTAPMTIPKDVRQLSFGPDAVIQTDNPQQIQKVRMNFPPEAGAQMESYQQDLMMGSRYPGTRSGQSPGSIVTGQGVNALEGGFDSQTMNYQNLLGFALKRAIGLCFKLDELLWKNSKKELRVMVNGSMFEETYTPSKDIDGIHEVEVTYGFAAGMDPNRALVFLLQMMSAGLADRDFVLQQMPFDLDSLQTLQRVDIEKLDDALKQGIYSMLTSMGVMIQQGQDPTQILQTVAKIITAREKGTPLHEAVLSAFKQPAAQAGPQSSQGPGSEQPSGPGGGSLQQALMGGNPLQPGTAPGQMAPGGRPDLMQMLSGLSPGGQPNLQANLQSRQPVGP